MLNNSGQFLFAEPSKARHASPGDSIFRDRKQVCVGELLHVMSSCDVRRVFAPAAIGPVAAPAVGGEERRPLTIRCSRSACVSLCAQIRDRYQSKQQTLDGDLVPPTHHLPKTLFQRSIPSVP